MSDIGIELKVKTTNKIIEASESNERDYENSNSHRRIYEKSIPQPSEDFDIDLGTALNMFPSPPLCEVGFHSALDFPNLAKRSRKLSLDWSCNRLT